MKLNIKNTLIENLPADDNLENSRRQVTEAVFSYVNPKKTKAPKVIHTSHEMADLLGISEKETQSTLFKNVFTGNKIYPNTKPVSYTHLTLPTIYSV